MREVTLQTAMQEVPGSIPDHGMDCYVCYFVLLLFWVLSIRHSLQIFCNPHYTAKYVTDYKDTETEQT